MAKSLERISLCLVALLVASAVSSAVECVGEDEGECWPVRNMCMEDHRDEWDQCFTLSTHQEHPQPNSNCRHQWPSWCSQVDSAALAPLPPLHLTHICTPLNPEEYNLSITWEAPVIGSHPTGYEVRLYKVGDFFPDYCFCLGPGTRSFTFAPFPYNSVGGQVRVDVTSLPILDSTFSSVSTTISVPSNCRDLSPDSPLCGPPEYGEVRNVSVRTLWARSSGEMELHVSWWPPLPLSSPPPNLPPPSVFYVMVQDSPTRSLCEVPESPCFKAINTTSVTVHSLNASRTYYVAVQSYQNCSGVRQEGGRRGCGNLKALHAVTVDPLPLPPPLPTTSLPATTTPTTSSSMLNPTPIPSPTSTATAETHSSHISQSTVIALAVVSVVLSLVVLLLIVVLTVAGLQWYCPKKTDIMQWCCPKKTDTMPEELELQNFADDSIPVVSSCHEGDPKGRVGTSPSCFGAPPPRALAVDKSCHEGDPKGREGTSPSCFAAPPPRALAVDKSCHEGDPKGREGTSPSCFAAPPPRALAVDKSCHESEPEGSDGTSCFKAPPPRALVVFSLNSPEKEKKLVLHYLVKVLRIQYGIRATSHVLEARTSPTDWTVQEFEGAAAVLCVCNRPFWQEWEGQNSGKECCAVVRTLKQLVHGTVAQGLELKRKKIAVVRLYHNHSQYIPPLLQNCRNYVVTDSEEIARFVIEQSPYRAHPVLS